MFFLISGLCGFFGLVNLDKARQNIYRANDINNKAAQIVKNAVMEIKCSNEIMKMRLKRLGKLKMDLMSGNISYVADTIRRIHQNCRINHDTQGLRELENLGFNEKILAEFENLSQKNIEFSSTEDFKLNDALSFCAVGAFGSEVLGLGTIAAPIALLYSFKKLDDSKIALYEAETRLDVAIYYVEYSKNICAFFDSISDKSIQVIDLLEKLNSRLDSVVEKLKIISNEEEFRRIIINEYTVHSFKDYTLENKNVVYEARQLTKAIKAIVDATIILKNLSINPDIDKFMESEPKNLSLLERPPQNEVSEIIESPKIPVKLCWNG